MDVRILFFLFLGIGGIPRAIGQIDAEEKLKAWADSAQRLMDEGKAAEAIPFYRKILSGPAALPDSAWLLSIRNKWHYAQLESQQVKGVEEDIRVTLDRCVQVFGPAHPETALAYNNQGAFLAIMGQFPEAYQHFLQAYQIQRKHLSGDDLHMLETLIFLGDIHLSLAKFDSAESYFFLALEATQGAEGPRALQRVRVLEKLSTLNRKSGKIRQHVSYAHQAVDLLRSLDRLDSPTGTQVLYTLGIAYLSSQEFEQALETAREALAVGAAWYEPDDPQLTKLYNLEGICYGHLGDYDRQLEAYHKILAIRIKEFGETHPTVAETYNNLGSAYYRKADFPTACDYYQKALDMRKRILGEAHPQTGITAFLLGRTQVKTREVDAAIANLALGQNIFESGFPNGHPYLGFVFEGLGDAWGEKGDLDQQMDYYEKKLALESRQRGKPDPYRAVTLLKVGGVYEKMRQIDKALAITQEAIHALDPQVDPENIWADAAPERVETKPILLKALIQKVAYVAHMAGKEGVDSPFFSYESRLLARADSLVHLMRRNLASDQAQREVLALADVIYNWGVIHYWRAYEASGQAAFVDTAFKYAEKYKSILLLEEVAEAEQRHSSGVPDSLIARRNTLATRVEELQRRIRNEGEGLADEALADLHANLVDARAGYRKTMESLAKDYPNYFQYRFSHQAPSLEKVRESLDHGNQALIAYFWSYEYVYAFSVYQDGVKLKRIPQDSMKVALEEVLHIIGDGVNAERFGNDPRAIRQFARQSHSLYRYLLGDLVPEGAEKLVVIPDGELAYLPFDVLVREAGEMEDYAHLRYVLQDLELQYAYSAALWMRPGQKDRDYSLAFAGFAPSYASTRFQAQRDVLTQAGLSEDVFEVYDLMFNQEEVEDVAQMLGGSVFTGAQATEQAFKTSAVGPRILHLALHGFAHPDRPPYSMLLFYPSADSVEDSYLYAYEIYHMQLNADLVVLSACNTGAGKLSKGEGVMSLARAFAYAGCNTILSSLWQADDLSTRQLMRLFYQGLDQGADRSDALRKAKMDFLASTDRKHPYYWAGFVMVGENGPVDTHEVSLEWLLGFFTALALFGGLLFWGWRKRQGIS